MKIKDYYSKLLPYAVAVVLLSATVISFPLLFIMDKADNMKYCELYEKALKYEKDGIFTEAEALYSQIPETSGDMYPVYMGLARCAWGLSEKKTFLYSCEKAIEKDCTKEDAYLLLISYYCEKKQYSEVYSVAERALENGCTSADIRDRTDLLDGTFTEKYLSADYVGDWKNSGGGAYAVFSRNGLYGIIRSDGYISLSAGYEKLGVFSADSGTFPALCDDVWCWLDGNEFRKLLAPEGTQEAGCFGNALAPVCVNGKWFYCSTDGTLSMLSFDFAGSFSNGVAAVMKDGKWALIDEKLRSITAYEFDMIKTDSNGSCSEYGTCVVKKEGLSYLCSLSGSILSEGFEDIALPAAESSYIAYKNNGEWGYLDVSGRIVIENCFENAKSFSMGYAPVYEDGLWYYIREDGKPANENRYEEAGCFSCEGRAVVRKENRLYVLTLARYS